MTYVTGWSAQSEGYNPEWQPGFDQMYGFNPAKAKALLKEAGYGPGQLKFKILAFTEQGSLRAPRWPRRWHLLQGHRCRHRDRGARLGQGAGDVSQEDDPVLHLAQHHLVAAIGGVDPDQLLEQEREPPLRNEFIDKTYNTLTQTIDSKERNRLARTIADHLLKSSPTSVVLVRQRGCREPQGGERVGLPGFGAGRSTHFHLIKAAK